MLSISLFLDNICAIALAPLIPIFYYIHEMLISYLIKHKSSIDACFLAMFCKTLVLILEKLNA
jgi:hypothetical protein